MKCDALMQSCWDHKQSQKQRDDFNFNNPDHVLVLYSRTLGQQHCVCDIYIIHT